MRVAVLGTGIMGAPMARHLVEAGHDVTVWNRTHAKASAVGAPVADIVEPAIEKAIEQSANALVVRHHDDLVPLGGIGAVLRF